MVSTRDVVRAWGALLLGRKPALSIEITKECPLRCPGCYAFSDGHVGGVDLKSLHDLRGDALISGVTTLVRRLRPLHVSLVGGDPMVRYRELEVIVPRLLGMGVFVQLVTSAFRPFPAAWSHLANLELVVSIDGLPADHDLRRAPATYERIQKNIAGQSVVVHCTLTSAMDRPGYLEEFIATWSTNPNIKKIWMSLFTPQIGEDLAEVPSPKQRASLIAELSRLRELYPKLDLPRGLIAQMAHPPASPRACIFARSTTVVSADLRSRVSPCQFGGTPDCARCGCFASMGLAAIGNHRLPVGIKAGTIFHASATFGEWIGSGIIQRR